VADFGHFVRSARTSAPDIPQSARGVSGQANSLKFYGQRSYTLGVRAGGKPGTGQPRTSHSRPEPEHGTYCCPQAGTVERRGLTRVAGGQLRTAGADSSRGPSPGYRCAVPGARRVAP
jgi:hypothetical protein